MRPLVRALRTWLCILAVGVVLSADHSALAVAGCCKERPATTAPWSPNKMDFATCRAMNQTKDGDDPFEPRGLVWWDVRCR